MEQESIETIISMMKDLQRQITYLERKIDTLVTQSSGGRPPGAKSFTPPTRTYGENQPRDSRGAGFGHKRREEGGRYGEKKRSFRPGDRDRGAKKFRDSR